MNIPSIKKLGTTSLFVLATIVFTASFAQGQLNQCSNGPRPGPILPCEEPNWVNGNIGNDSQYQEGDSVSFRRIGRRLEPGSEIILTIEYDTTKAGKHAYDYLTSYDQTNTDGNDPCSGIIGCDLANPTDTAPIPTDPRVTAGPDGIPLTSDDIVQIPGEFTIWGGTITNVAATYGLTGTYAGDSTTTLQLTILVGDANTLTGDTNVVLAWGGHIASRFNWGFGGSAALIPGSPYHMSTNLDPDRSLSVADVTFPAVIWFRKAVTTFIGALTSTQIFPFDSPATYLNSGTNAPIDSFNLVDDTAVADPLWEIGTIQKGKTSVFGTPLLFTEGQVFGWGASDVTCEQFDAGFGTNVAGVIVTDTGIGDADADPFEPAFANLTVQEGAGVRCTFSNLQGQPTAADVFLEGRAVGTNGRGLSGINVTLTDINTGQSKTAVTNTFGYFKFEDLEIGYVYILSAFNKRYTFEEQTLVLTSNVTGVTLVGTPR